MSTLPLSGPEILAISMPEKQCCSYKTIVKNYIPPQFFYHFSALNKLCKVRRQEDNSLKTQIRFGEKDLEILTKEKGSEEAFQVEDLRTFIGDCIIPEFDYRLKWKIQTDRPPRRIVSSSSPESAAWKERTDVPAGAGRMLTKGTL